MDFFRPPRPHFVPSCAPGCASACRADRGCSPTRRGEFLALAAHLHGLAGPRCARAQCGGRGASLTEQAIFQEDMAAARAAMMVASASASGRR
jgi:hypothetical protein